MSIHDVAETMHGQSAPLSHVRASDRPDLNSCTWRAPMVTLADGREAPSDSEEWRAECEAKWVLDLPSKAARHDFVYGPVGQDGIRRGGVAKRRGMEAAKRLEQRVRRLWSFKLAEIQKQKDLHGSD